MRAIAAIASVFVLGGTVASEVAHAQGRGRIETWMPPWHWSRGALRVLAGLGMIEAGASVAAWPAPRSLARALVDSAAARTTTDRPAREAAAATSIAALFNILEGESSADAGVEVRMRTGLGYDDHTGALRGGTTVRADGGAWVYPGPVPLRRPRGTTIATRVDLVGPSAHVGAALDTRVTGGDAVLHEAYVIAAAGPLAAWLGRRQFGFGPGTSGSLVLSSDVPIDGFGVTTRDGFRLPGPLGRLGTLRATGSLARLERSGSVERPWLGAMRLGVAPHPSIAIGLNRALLLGGDGNVEPTSARNVLLAIAGLSGQLGKDSGFENQVASIDVWLRGRALGLPWAAYAEWAADDVGFSFARVTALLAGLELAAVPLAPRLSLGIEHVRFPRSCCGHPPWYRHGDLGDGWTVGGRPLGHRLGGHGTQWAAHARFVAPRLWLEANAFTRDRGGENLFSPDRQGVSRGGRIAAELATTRATRLRTRTSFERGPRWSAWTFDLRADLAVRIGNRTSH